MITNEKQYRSTRSLIGRLKLGLAGTTDSGRLPEELIDMQRDALASQIEELEEDAALYDDLRSGRITIFEADGLNQLPDILIRARIARGMSQKDLAAFLGLKEQQIQRYEAERYRSASLDRLVEIAEALSVQIRNRAELVGDGRLTLADPSVWQAFPIAEMYKRGWFEDFPGTMAEARKAAADLVPAFLQGVGSRHAPAALHRKSVRASGQVHEASIAAWEARVRQLAERDPPAIPFDAAAIDEPGEGGRLSARDRHLADRRAPSARHAARRRVDGECGFACYRCPDAAPRPARQFLVHLAPRDRASETSYRRPGL